MQRAIDEYAETQGGPVCPREQGGTMAYERKPSPSSESRSGIGGILTIGLMGSHVKTASVGHLIVLTRI